MIVKKNFIRRNIKMKNFRCVGIAMAICLLILPLFAQETTERTAREFLYNGDQQFNAKEFTPAIENYQKSLKIFKDLAEENPTFKEDVGKVLYKLYASATNLKNYQLATQYGEETLIYDPSNEAVIKNISLMYRTQLKDNAKAVAVWENYDRVYDNYNAKVAIADIYEKNSDLKNALIWYNKALEVNKDPDVVRRVAKLYLDNKQPQQAIQFYEDFIATNPSRKSLGTTYKNMGTLYKDSNNINKAIEKYEQALEIEYDKAVSLWLIDQYYHLPNLPKAKTHIQNVLSKTNNEAGAIYYKALILKDEKKPAEAKVEFQKLVNDKNYGTSAQGFIKSIDAEN